MHCLRPLLYQLPSAPLPPVQRQQVTLNMLVCDSCGKDFTSERSLATHKSRDNCKGPKVRYQVIPRGLRGQIPPPGPSSRPQSPGSSSLHQLNADLTVAASTPSRSTSIVSFIQVAQLPVSNSIL